MISGYFTVVVGLDNQVPEAGIRILIDRRQRKKAKCWIGPRTSLRFSRRRYRSTYVFDFLHVRQMFSQCAFLRDDSSRGKNMGIVESAKKKLGMC